MEGIGGGMHWVGDIMLLFTVFLPLPVAYSCPILIGKKCFKIKRKPKPLSKASRARPSSGSWAPPNNQHAMS